MITKEWNKKTLSMKIVSITGIILSIVITVLAAMQIFNIWDKAINVFEPLLGVLMIIQTIEYWKTNRKMAFVSLCVGILILYVAVKIILM